MVQSVLRVTGRNGQLELTDSVLRIELKGLLTFFAVGLQGAKEIPLSEITAVNFRRPKGFINGCIGFAFAGSVQSNRGMFEGSYDANTVIFTEDQQPQFERFRDELQRRIAGAKSVGPTRTESNLEQIEKLGALREKGLITQDEFQIKKRQLLGL